MRYLAKTIKTKYWKPGEDFVNVVIDSAGRLCKAGDILVVSEKAVSIAKGRIIDESRVKRGALAKVITVLWMRKVWGYILGYICRLNKENIERLRSFPLEGGTAHKQLALEYAGFGQALRHFSEGGIDVSNLPYSYACLPLEDAQKVAKKIHRSIEAATGKKVAIMIADSDKTYSFGGLHLTPRPKPLKGIVCLGLTAYVIGRLFKGKPRSTPLALAGINLVVEEALKIAAIANKVRGYGAGRTIWDMAEHFGVELTEVTWEMLEEVNHCPIVVVRRVLE